MERSPLIAIYQTEKGWCLRQEEELGYYSSLPDVMHVAYSKNGEAVDNGTSVQGDHSSLYRRSP